MRLFFIAFAALSSFLSAETITLLANERHSTSTQPVYSQETITLAEGDLATVLFMSSAVNLDVIINGVIVRLGSSEATRENLPVIAGPATLRALNFSNLNAALATISIKRATETTPVVSPQAVVIPDDGSGDREVRLESSTDLINWTATQPGLFASSSASRFFRVRMVKVTEE